MSRLMCAPDPCIICELMSPEPTPRQVAGVSLAPDKDRRGERRPYQRGRVVRLGDIRDLTLGGSPTDVGDSPFPNTRIP